MKLVIERKRWLRGADNSALLRDDGLMCCLGFYGEACGIGSDDMLDTADPEECGTAVLSMWPAWLLGFKNDQRAHRRRYRSPSILVIGAEVRS
jgi:hypothetical protein